MDEPTNLVKGLGLLKGYQPWQTRKTIKNKGRLYIINSDLLKILLLLIIFKPYKTKYNVQSKARIHKQFKILKVVTLFWVHNHEWSNEECINS